MGGCASCGNAGADSGAVAGEGGSTGGAGRSAGGSASGAPPVTEEAGASPGGGAAMGGTSGGDGGNDDGTGGTAATTMASAVPAAPTMTRATAALAQSSRPAMTGGRMVPKPAWIAGAVAACVTLARNAATRANVAAGLAVPHRVTRRSRGVARKRSVAAQPSVSRELCSATRRASSSATSAVPSSCSCKLARSGALPAEQRACCCSAGSETAATTSGRAYDVNAAQNGLHLRWRETPGIVAKQSPIDRCAMRDVGHRIAVEPGVLLRQQDDLGQRPAPALEASYSRRRFNESGKNCPPSPGWLGRPLGLPGR